MIFQFPNFFVFLSITPSCVSYRISFYSADMIYSIQLILECLKPNGYISQTCLFEITIHLFLFFLPFFFFW
ncbi:hypothetical protein CROQUDRAFT_169969 [Cronartium quercuum f. sp. fusiforme G11]|uniref:Uncharacterized protein n=1 Tax=Cronartium quercuum f. sp. fusiforme G11 TaxID=708437 RepID=A0A9P6NBN3_9BASI|nr:hypothetical protein CROQUDRAFT_169969 [Cronartium quercuum f. sp. fusiforme G11]